MLKYILVLLLLAAAVHFLNSIARLGREGGRTPKIGGRGAAGASTAGGPAEGKEIEDAEYEILPDTGEEPPHTAG